MKRILSVIVLFPLLFSCQQEGASGNEGDPKNLIITGSAGDITECSAQLSGNAILTSDSGSAVLDELYFSVRYSEIASSVEELLSDGISSNPVLSDVGTFCIKLENLAQGTEYHYVIVAKLHDTEYYSEVGSFRTRFFATLCLNEINGVAGQKSIELYNHGEQDVSLKNWEIRIVSGNEKTSWKGDGGIIPAHGYQVIKAESDSEEITLQSMISSKLNILSNNRTLSVELINPEGNKSDSLKRGMDDVKAILRRVEGSYARISDNGDTWKVLSPTIGGSNNNAEIIGSINFDPIVIYTIRFIDIQPVGAFGGGASGLQVTLTGNVDKELIYVTLLCDSNLSEYSSPQSNQWKAIKTVESYEKDTVAIRFSGPDMVLARYAVEIRDELGYSTIKNRIIIYNPIRTGQVSTTKFANASLPDDNCKSTNVNYYPVNALWDGSGISTIPHFFASSESPRPCWLTINLGQTARLSDILTLPRMYYMVYGGAAVRSFEFWGWGKDTDPDGSKDNNNPHGFQSGWVLLGEFSQDKPSGYEPDGAVGRISAEDNDYYNTGNIFVLDASKWPHANDPVRYLRVVFVDTFTSFNTNDSTMSVQLGEVVPVGSVVN